MIRKQDIIGYARFYTVYGMFVGSHAIHKSMTDIRGLIVQIAENRAEESIPGLHTTYEMAELLVVLIEVKNFPLTVILPEDRDGLH